MYSCKEGQYHATAATANDAPDATSPGTDRGGSPEGPATLCQSIVAGTGGSLKQGTQQERTLALGLPTRHSV